VASPPWDGNHARVTNGRRAIGLDIGGTKVAGAIVGEDGTVHAELRRNTPDTSDADTMTTLLREMVEELRGDAEGADVSAIGVGAAGTVACWSPRAGCRWSSTTTATSPVWPRPGSAGPATTTWCC
jgi:glucokinase